MEKKKKLIDEALNVYGISKEHVFNSRIDEETGEAVIVTHGGKKIKHRKGEKAKFKLNTIEKTGKPPRPRKKMIWDEKLNQWRMPDKAEVKSKSSIASGHVDT